MFTLARSCGVNMENEKLIETLRECDLSDRLETREYLLVLLTRIAEALGIEGEAVEAPWGVSWKTDKPKWESTHDFLALAETKLVASENGCWGCDMPGMCYMGYPSGDILDAPTYVHLPVFAPEDPYAMTVAKLLAIGSILFAENEV